MPSASTTRPLACARRDSVPSFQLVNHGSLPVLILDGEEVVGGPQNRVVNTTLLIAANSVFDLLVSCVEHWGWREARKGFGAGEAVPRHYADGRPSR